MCYNTLNYKYLTQKIMKKYTKIILVSTLGLTLSACSFTLTTPSRSIIKNQQIESSINIIDVNLPLAQKLYQSKEKQKFSEFKHTKKSFGAVNIGDVLSISIWESPPAVLFGATGINDDGVGNSQLIKLPDQMISHTGRITVPFIGTVRVKGKTPRQIQSILKSLLSKKANDPQVIVQVKQNNSANVAVIRKGNSVRMPLTAHGEQVLDAVAAVGGVSSNIQDITVQLTREKNIKSISFEDLIADPNQNIKLMSGDVVTLLDKPLSFTGLGALGKNTRVKFPSRGVSLGEAIAQMGGVTDSLADPKGVFIFRYIPLTSLPEIEQTKWFKKGFTKDMEVPTVYNVDLLQPESLFILQRFPIQDKDIVYVANSPLVEFSKFVKMVFTVFRPAIDTIKAIKNF